MIEPTAMEAEELKTATKPDKKEQLYNISQALAVLASASVWSESLFLLVIFKSCISKEREKHTLTLAELSSPILQSVAKERQEFLSLVNKEVWSQVRLNIYILLFAQVNIESTPLLNTDRTI
jgi:hypothetical protein